MTIYEICWKVGRVPWEKLCLLQTSNKAHTKADKILSLNEKTVRRVDKNEDFEH